MTALGQIYPNLLRVAAVVISGVFMAFAFPPMGDAQSAWGSLIPLIILARLTAPVACFWWGYAAGLICWLMSLSWILKLGVTGAPWPLAILGWILLSAYCAVYWGAFLFVAGKLFKHWGSESTLMKPLQVILMTLTWVGLEYVRGHLFTGFPWNQVGISQYRNTSIIQVAEFGGVYAVSAVVVVINCALAMTALRFIGIYRRMSETYSRISFDLTVGLVLCAASWMYGSNVMKRARMETTDGTSLIKVAAVQPCIPQLKKWDETFEQGIYEKVKLFTDLAAGYQPDLIVWPETAVPNPIKSDRMTWDFVAGLASNRAPILAGTMELEQRGDSAVLFNSAILVGTNCEIVAEYRKKHLVPFGEYIPLSSVIPILHRCAPLGFSCEAGDVSTVFITGASRVPFSTLICFEDIFPGLSREAVLRGARLLINQTNDGWYDGTSGPEQHMSHCVFRCVENRVPAVRAANTGVSCLIDKYGRIHRIEEDPKVFAVDIPKWEKPVTFYTQYGDWPFAIPCGLIALLTIVLSAYSERKESGRKEPETAGATQAAPDKKEKKEEGAANGQRPQ